MLDGCKHVGTLTYICALNYRARRSSKNTVQMLFNRLLANGVRTIAFTSQANTSVR